MKSETDAAVAAAVAAWPQGRTYRVGEVPPSPVTPYNVVGVDSGLSRNYRKGSTASSRLHRLSVQSVGKDATEVIIAIEHARAAFLDQRLPVSGAATTPCREETAADVQRDPDGGALLYAFHSYKFTTNPA